MTTPCCALKYVSPTDFLFTPPSINHDVATAPTHTFATSFATSSRHHHQNKRARRSGCIILDYKTGRILIIQSYHQYWGLPKGRVEENETHVECAIRETFEETGIQLSEQDLQRKYNIFNGDGTYFLVDGTRLTFDESKICNKQEITGICWMCPSCIRRNIRFQEMTINSHLRLLLPTIIKELSDNNHQKQNISKHLSPTHLSPTRLSPTHLSPTSPLTTRLKKIESISM